jgi:hypothetical protein
VWQTIAGDRLDWEIGDWSVGVFLVSTDPATGARQRLPGFEFSFNFYEVGFWAPRLRSSSEYGVVLPVINVTLYVLCVVLLALSRSNVTKNCLFSLFLFFSPLRPKQR